MNTSSLCMLLLALQYFVFELAEYKHKVDSKSFEEFQRKLKRLRLLKYIALSISFASSFPKIMIEYEDHDPFHENSDLFEG
jgi:hypothetical protein